MISKPESGYIYPEITWDSFPYDSALYKGSQTFCTNISFKS
jgi:hypothetical protein